MQLKQLSWPQIQQLSKETVVLISTAATEQHGPHLPIGTDTMIAEGLVEAIDQACGGKLLVLPVQHLGCSEHHMAFSGSLTLDHETFCSSVLQTVHSMIRHGFHRILILNAHGGNQGIGEVIAEKASVRWPEAEVLFTSWWRVAREQLKTLVEGEFPSVGHACEFETSVMMVFQPQLVQMELAQDDGIPPKASQLQSDLFSKATSARHALPFHIRTKQGVFGRPTLASEEKGIALFI